MRPFLFRKSAADVGRFHIRVALGFLKKGIARERACTMNRRPLITSGKS
jgi:hypothetical protein